MLIFPVKEETHKNKEAKRFEELFDKMRPENARNCPSGLYKVPIRYVLSFEFVFKKKTTRI